MNYRRRPGGSVGEGMAADFPLLGELAVTCTGAGCGSPRRVPTRTWQSSSRQQTTQGLSLHPGHF